MSKGYLVEILVKHGESKAENPYASIGFPGKLEPMFNLITANFIRNSLCYALVPGVVKTVSLLWVVTDRIIIVLKCNVFNIPA